MRNREWFYSLKPREMVEWLDSEHVEDELRFADECRDPGVTGWWPDERDCMAEAAEVPSDSREKLEADARNLQERIWNAGANHDGISLRHILELLDRQAAITERETRLRELCRFEENHRRHVRSIEDVNQQLNGRIAALAGDLGRCMAESDGYRDKLGRAVDSAWEIVQLMDDESCGAAGSERSSCEVYVLDDGTYQCGNCGAIIVGVVAEGESEDGDWA